MGNVTIKSGWLPLPLPSFNWLAPGGYLGAGGLFDASGLAGGIMQTSDGAHLINWSDSAAKIQAFSFSSLTWTNAVSFPSGAQSRGFAPVYGGRYTCWFDEATHTFNAIDLQSGTVRTSPAGVDSMDFAAFPSVGGYRYKTNGAGPKLLTAPGYSGQFYWLLTDLFGNSVVTWWSYRTGRPVLIAAMKAGDARLPNFTGSNADWAGQFNFLVPGQPTYNGSPGGAYFSPATWINTAALALGGQQLATLDGTIESQPIAYTHCQQYDASAGPSFFNQPQQDFVTGAEAICEGYTNNLMGPRGISAGFQSGLQLANVLHAPVSFASNQFLIPLEVPVPSDFTSNSWLLANGAGTPSIIDGVGHHYIFALIEYGFDMRSTINWTGRALP
jgi:hypothetical protein